MMMYTDKIYTFEDFIQETVFVVDLKFVLRLFKYLISFPQMQKKKKNGKNLLNV